MGPTQLARGPHRGDMEESSDEEGSETLLPSSGPGRPRRSWESRGGRGACRALPRTWLLAASLLLAAPLLLLLPGALRSPRAWEVSGVDDSVRDFPAPPAVSCNATSPLEADFLQRFLPCGTLIQACGHLPVVHANRDYPGSGPLGDVEDRDYIVQFDVGMNSRVARASFEARFSMRACLNCSEEFSGFDETCLEAVVRGRADWGALDGSVPGLARGAYDCMGRCGRGCMGRASGGLDCLKHDVCSAWKSQRRQRPVAGYCRDPDCGDEGAQALYNCRDKQGKPAVCSKETSGGWSPARWLGMGWCGLYQGWDRGQGIPPQGHWLR